jgi:Ca2+-binding EF-hand superfamily protein
VDKNGDEVLELREIITFLNNGLRSVGKTPNATFADARSFLEAYDSNRDRVISKQEMFQIIKTIIYRYHK